MLGFNKNNRDSLSVASVRYPVVQIISKLHMIKQIRMSKRKKGQRKAASRRVPGSHDTTLAWFRHDGHIGGPTFADVDDRNVFTCCDTKMSSLASGTRHTKPGVSDSSHNFNHLFRLPNDLRGHDDGARHVVTLPTQTDYSRRYDRQP